MGSLGLHTSKKLLEKIFDLNKKNNLLLEDQ
jgi:hypothetical protein